MRLDISYTQSLFGAPASLYGPIIAGIVPRMANVPYRFWDNNSVAAAIADGSAGVADINAIVAAELLLGAHLAAVTSIVRASRWIEATWREHEAENILGWAACCRSLLESTGDTIDALGSMGADIAENTNLLMRALSGYDEALLDLGSLEDKLIHFSHARKINKAEKDQVPSSHVARHTTDYINLLKSAGLSGPAALYAELCEIGHPARSSISWMYEQIDGGFRINPNHDAPHIASIVERYRNDIFLLPSLAFNPGLLILRVLVKFGMFPLVPELRGFSFQGAKAWDKIKPVLAGAPPTLRRNWLVDQITEATKTSCEVLTFPY
jgi:hypothetical protein